MWVCMCVTVCIYDIYVVFIFPPFHPGGQTPSDT